MDLRKATFAASILVLAAVGRSSGQMDDVPHSGAAPTDQTAGQVRFELMNVDALGDLRNDLGIEPNRLHWHIPDLETARQIVERLLARAEEEGDRSGVAIARRNIERIDTTRRPQRLQLSLDEVLRRALENNYILQVERYNPAVETTRVVEAEAAFDAVFFSSISKSIIDRPTGSQLISSKADVLNSTYGVRKLLPSGMQVSASYSLDRTKSSLSFQQINPEYFSTIDLEVRQPFLRGFGLDYNRSVIRLSKNDERVSMLAFRRRVRDTLREVEEAYWRLVQARRDLVVEIRLLAEFEAIYEYLEARQAFDATPVQLSATKADLETSKSNLVALRAAVFDAEDDLIATMNDPELNLVNETEIIPADFPDLARLQVDHIADVQTALENRPEIKEQELQIASARILLHRAKIDELPRLDVLFRYSIDGLAGNADKSFDEVSRHNYVEYLIGIEFELPIGNRGPRAAHERARLQHSQAMAQLRAVIEQTILDVNRSVRALVTSYDQIAPSFESAEAREREVESIVARAERKDFNTLTNELNSRTRLAASRRAMLRRMVDYNIAIFTLEAAKGTLLRYNNVVIADGDEEYPEPSRDDGVFRSGGSEVHTAPAGSAVDSESAEIGVLQPIPD